MSKRHTDTYLSKGLRRWKQKQLTNKQNLGMCYCKVQLLDNLWRIEHALLGYSYSWLNMSLCEMIFVMHLLKAIFLDCQKKWKKGCRLTSSGLVPRILWLASCVTSSVGDFQAKKLSNSCPEKHVCTWMVGAEPLIIISRACNSKCYRKMLFTNDITNEI